MDFKRGISRDQGTLFPERLDDYIDEENPVRFIDAYVDQLDLKDLGLKRTTPTWTGRAPYAPQDLLKLYIYGYLNKIRPSRKLERETYRNIEVMLLICRLHPDHKTIADFRKDNRKAFKGVFRAFTHLCNQLALFGGELIAVDGSKFKAVNSPKRHFTKKKLEDRVVELDEKIEHYLQSLDAADAEADALDVTSSQGDVHTLKEKIEQLKDRQETYMQLLEDLETRGETQVSLTDPDSRSMPKSPNAKIGYNVQIGVDDKHHLIATQDVINQGNDAGQLSTVSMAAKEVLDQDQDRLKVVADSGYYNSDEIKACEDANIEPYVPKRDTSNCKSRGLYSKDLFHYDPVQDYYSCPKGEVLTYRSQAPKYVKGKPTNHIQRSYASKACKSCLFKLQCTTNKRGRVIKRWVHEHLIEQMEDRMRAHPEILEKRKGIVEHPFWHHQVLE